MLKNYYLNGIKYWYNRHQGLWYYEDEDGDLHFERTKQDVEDMILITCKKKLVLTKSESKELLETGSVEIERNGFPMLIEENSYFNENEPESCMNKRYYVTIIDIFDKVILK